MCIEPALVRRSTFFFFFFGYSEAAYRSAQQAKVCKDNTVKLFFTFMIYAL